MIFNPTYLKGGLIQKNGQQLGGSEGPWKEKPSALEGALRTGDFRNVGGAGVDGVGGWGQGIQRLKSLGCPGVPSECPKPPEQRPRLCQLLFLPVCVSCFANAAPLLHVFSLAGVGWWWGLQNSPLWDGEEDRRRRRTKSKGAGAGQQGGLPLAQLPGPGPKEGTACPSPFPPPAPQGSLAASLPAGTLPSQTAARGRGRSISEQRGPCGLQLKPRIPLSHRQVKRGVCAHAHRHARMAPGSPGPGLRAWQSVGGGDGAGCLGAGLGGLEGQGP